MNTEEELLTYPYSIDFHPPAPMLDVDCSSPISGTSIAVPALVDSGADMTVLPSDVVSRLQLGRTGFITAVGLEALPTERSVFSAAIQIAGRHSVSVRVITWDGSFALLGRNVINEWRLVLDGPASSMTIS